MSVVILDVVLPEHNSSFVPLEVLRKFSRLHVAEIHERCEMKEAPVIFRLLNFFCLGISFEVPGQQSLKLVPLFVTAALASGIVTASLMDKGVL